MVEVTRYVSTTLKKKNIKNRFILTRTFFSKNKPEKMSLALTRVEEFFHKCAQDQKCCSCQILEQWGTWEISLPFPTLVFLPNEDEVDTIYQYAKISWEEAFDAVEELAEQFINDCPCSNHIPMTCSFCKNGDCYDIIVDKIIKYQEEKNIPRCQAFAAWECPDDFINVVCTCESCSKKEEDKKRKAQEKEDKFRLEEDDPNNKRRKIIRKKSSPQEEEVLPSLTAGQMISPKDFDDLFDTIPRTPIEEQ